MADSDCIGACTTEPIPPAAVPNPPARDAAGRFVGGNLEAVKHALRTTNLPPEFQHLAAEVEVFVAGCLSDEGGAENVPTRRLALLEYRARLHRRAIQLDAAIELRGLRLTKPDPESTHVPSSWSPDGKRLLFSVGKGSNTSLWTLSVPDKTAARVSDVRSPNETDGAFSPDGRWVAYTSTTGTPVAQSSVFVQPFPSTGAKYSISSESSAHPLWSSDGKELFFSSGGPGQVHVVRVTTQPSFVFGDRTPVPGVLRAIDRGPFTPRNYDITPDGKGFIGVVVSGQAQTGESAAPQIQVVLNWFEELRRLVPPK